MSTNGHDAAFNIVRQLLRIDNRKDAEIAKETELSAATIAAIRKGDRSYIRSTTIAVLVRAAHRKLIVK
jgi:hypothetical protein